MKRRLITVPAVLAVSAVVVAGCGSSGSSNNSSGSGASGSSASAQSSPYGGVGVTKAAGTGGTASKGATTVALHKGALGSFLVDSKGMSLYLFQKDQSTQSMCNGACAQAWPPLTTKGKPQAGNGVQASLLGTSKRSDGSTMVTYKGHPLYYYAGDVKPGDTSGQGVNGFGALWYVVNAKGASITAH